MPTWNYTSVHFTGPVTFHRDADWLRDIVTRLTERHESHQDRPWRVEDAPAAYIDEQLRGIVGVEMSVARVEAKDKLSQNRSAADRAGAVAGLRGTADPGAHAIAELMRARDARRLWTEDQPFDFDGRCYQLTGAVCEPKPVQRPHPPIMIGGGGEKATLRVVAEHADIWNCPARTAEEYSRKNRVLLDHCAAVGRDSREITRSVQILVRGDDPAAARGLLLELIDAGVTHLVLGPIPPWPGSPARGLAEEIIEPVLAAAAAG